MVNYSYGNITFSKKVEEKIHRAIALAQDIIILEIYEKSSSAVIHGDTAIWRCFGSNRFSEDIDVYFPLSFKNENFNLFPINLEKNGFKIEKLKKLAILFFANFYTLKLLLDLKQYLKI